MFFRLITLSNTLKSRVKKKKFEKYATCGHNFTVSASSNCFIESGGEVLIGSNTEICGIISCKSSAKVIIGSNTTIRGFTQVGAVESVVIGDNVIISNNVHIYDNNNHPISPNKRKCMCESGFNSDLWHWKYADNSPVIIESNTWIGARSTILKGVTIGQGSIVACDSVVTKNVPPFTIVAGNPAKVVKQIENDLFLVQPL